ncbi:MAG: hypothetical protein ACSLFA_18250 [Mycobacterium sp.]
MTAPPALTGAPITTETENTMDHAFDLAFALLDEAAERIEHQQYGITRIVFHKHGPIQLTTVHNYTPDNGHHLVLLAADEHGQLVAIEATAPDLDTTPTARILKVRAGDLTFHATADTWTYRATGAHTYQLTAGIGEEPMWSLAIDNSPLALAYDDLQQVIDHIDYLEPLAA